MRRVSATARCATPADTDVDAIVVGTGGAGSAAACALARRGRTVVAFDRFASGHDRGSSHGTERIFRYAYPEACFVELAIDAWPRWLELQQLAGEPLLLPTGGIDVGDDAQLELLATQLAAHGLPFEHVDATAARERVPGLRVAGSAVFQPGAAVILAERALAAFRNVATHAGARFVDEDAVIALHAARDGTVVVETARGSTLCGRVAIVTAGAWTAPLLAGLAPLPPIVVTQEQVGFFRPRQPVDLPVFIAYGEVPVYGLRTPDGLVKVAEHGSGPVVDPDRRTFALEPARWRALLEWVAANLPAVDPQPVDARTCLYASAPADRFVLDRVGPFVIGAGLGGHAFKFLPSIGARLADLADGIVQGVDAPAPNPFALADHP